MAEKLIQSTSFSFFMRVFYFYLFFSLTYYSIMILLRSFDTAARLAANFNEDYILLACGRM